VKLSGEYVFDGPREAVWELLRDPDVLATALPGTQALTKISENEYEGKINLRIGPVAGIFAGKLVISNEQPPESYTLTVEGRGSSGFGKGSGDCQLVDQGNGTTLLRYQGDLQVGGTIANVGQRLIESVANSMTKQAFEALNRALQARLAAEAEGIAVEYVAPTEAQFAAAVARDMAGQVLASRQTRIAAALLLVVAVLVGFWVVTRRR
jgi:hypothetical protein